MKTEVVIKLAFGLLVFLIWLSKIHSSGNKIYLITIYLGSNQSHIDYIPVGRGNFRCVTDIRKMQVEE